jgi:2-oxoacid:acceptor oxidoreductase gamma subunit (pyruvate/2-ketoisovalerate family)
MNFELVIEKDKLTNLRTIYFPCIIPGILIELTLYLRYNKNVRRKNKSGNGLMNTEFIQIRWHGRGGQGAIKAAKIVAGAAFVSGYSGVVMAPTFGTERRGAPVMTSLKIARHKIYDLSPIETPDIIVVLDHLLLTEEDVICGLKPGGVIVLNTPKVFESYNFKGFRLAIADITAISVEAGLPLGMVNTGIIGTLARATNILDMDILIKGIEEEFRTRRPGKNSLAAKIAFEKTVTGG